jgi:hypothetical protein
VLFPVGIGLLLAGCSNQAIRDGFGLVEGKITYQNKPLGGGTIHFFQDQEPVGSTMIRGDGKYAAEIPLGQIRVAIETTSVKYHDRQAVLNLMKENGFDVPPEQRKPNSPAFTALPTTFVEIPERFGDPEQSGLEFTVERGRQTRDIDLK